MQTLNSALASTATDAATAIVADGTNMVGAIEGTCTALDGVAGTVMGFITPKYNDAVTVHDKFQQDLNAAAEENVRNYEGVTSVTSS